MACADPTPSMVRSRARRPVRRSRNAGPIRRSRSSAPPPDVTQPLDEDKYPNLAAMRDGDRLQHIHQARRAGLTRKQASKHADEDLLGRES